MRKERDFPAYVRAWVVVVVEADGIGIGVSRGGRTLDREGGREMGLSGLLSENEGWEREWEDMEARDCLELL